MKKQVDLEELEKEAWPLKKKFLKIVEPYRSELWRYCHYLTRNPWDAEELVQETLLKAFASLSQIWQPLKPKHYLFRIATNTWINQQRKNSSIEGEYSEEIIIAGREPATFEITESIEILMQHLPLRQVVIILLMDVFEFTARETAEMLSTTEGAVKSALYRARQKLKIRSKEEENHLQTKVELNKYKNYDDKTLAAFVAAFNQRDPDAMAALLDENAYHDIVHVGQEYGRDIIRKYSIADDFKDPTIHLQHAEVREILGRPVMVVFIKQEEELQLHDIIDIQTEEGRIVFFRHYYFCEDFLREASQKLNVPVQSGKSYKLD